jgi:hypothetical protein
MPRPRRINIEKTIVHSEIEDSSSEIDFDSFNRGSIVKKRTHSQSTIGVDNGGRRIFLSPQASGFETVTVIIRDTLASYSLANHIHLLRRAILHVLALDYGHIQPLEQVSYLVFPTLLHSLKCKLIRQFRY